ncbi:MAG TPA: DEAD/DEAH box helicase [Thermoanaerobaculia bacterium]|nr:DEAD/DEAH box helicase [Thermoanaerobaculia bacterium]
MLAEHQRHAADRAFELLQTRGGLLLADDVGLGKSFVAAEVMRRFGGACELIVPAALIAQWRDTLVRFDVDAHIQTHDGIEEAQPFAAPRLVVVDEAHAFRNPRTQRYAGLARRTAGARVLLVTATPVCNSIDDLSALLRIIARDDLLADAGVPSIDVAFETRDLEAIDRIVATLLIRRDRSVLPASLRFGELDRRVIRHPVLDAPQIDELQFPLVGEHAILRRFLRRRLESSEAALVESLRRQLRFYERALSAIAAGRTLPKREYRRAFAHEEDRPAFQDVLFWEVFAPPGDADPEEIRAEMKRIEALMELARAAPSVKRDLLVEALDGEPTLIFTGSVATARDLAAALRCGCVTSRDGSRDAVLHAFTSGRIDLVVSTDIAAEGLNLQRAGTIVHYDIPWNPVKLDQRNGRAHRIGQQRDSVRAIYFIPQSRETRIVETIARKNRGRRRVLTPLVQPAPIAQQRTLRPRVTREAAWARLQNPPELLVRRHKAGIEQLIAELPLDALLRLVQTEA